MAAAILDFMRRIENRYGGCRVDGVGYGVWRVGCWVLGVGGRLCLGVLKNVLGFGCWRV